MPSRELVDSHPAKVYAQANNQVQDWWDSTLGFQEFLLEPELSGHAAEDG